MRISSSVPAGLVFLTVVACLGVGCSDDGGSAADTGADNTSDASAAAAADASSPDVAGSETSDQPAGEDSIPCETPEDESDWLCCADTCVDDWCAGALCSHGTWVCEWPKKHIGDAFNGGDCSNVCSSTPARGMLCSIDGWICDPELAGALDSCPAERVTVCYSCSGWSPSADNPCNCACESGVVKCGG